MDWAFSGGQRVALCRMASLFVSSVASRLRRM